MCPVVSLQIIVIKSEKPIHYTKSSLGQRPIVPARIWYNPIQYIVILCEMSKGLSFFGKGEDFLVNSVKCHTYCANTSKQKLHQMWV